MKHEQKRLNAVREKDVDEILGRNKGEGESKDNTDVTMTDAAAISDEDQAALQVWSMHATHTPS